MKRFLLMSIAVLATLTITAGSASAAKFKSASATINSNGTLVITFKEIGLGDRQGVTYQVSANASATYACINNGGNRPRAANKTGVQQPLSAGTSGQATRNGTFTCNGCLSLGPVACDAGCLTCPGTMTKKLLNVSYTNITLTDTTNGVSVSIGNKSATLP